MHFPSSTIRMWSGLILVGLFTCSLRLPATGRETARPQETPKTPSHFLFQVNTELQRELLPIKADLMVYVDSTKGITPGEFDIKALQLPEIRKKLQPLKKGHPRVHFTVFFPKGAAYKQPGKKLVELANEIGFNKATTDSLCVNDDRTWETYSKPLNQKPDKPEEDEPVVTDGITRGYPVRTTLSRWLTSNADWVIDMPALQKEEKQLPQSTIDSAIAMITRMKIPPKNVVAFRLEHPENNAHRLISEQVINIGKNAALRNTIILYH